VLGEEDIRRNHLLTQMTLLRERCLVSEEDIRRNHLLTQMTLLRNLCFCSCTPQENQIHVEHVLGFLLGLQKKDLSDRSFL